MTIRSTNTYITIRIGNMTYPSKRDSMYNAFLESTPICMKKDDQTILGITEEYSLANSIKELEIVIKRIVKSNSNLFSLKKRKDLINSYIDCTKLGECVVYALRGIPEIQMHYPFHSFSPYVEAFISCVNDKIMECIRYNGVPSNPEGMIIYVALMNEFVSNVRSKINTKAFQSEISNHQRPLNKNFKELKKYIKAIFEQHSRVLVLRIDFGYLNRFCSSPWQGDTVTYDEVKEHREILFRHLNRKILKDSMLGFAWKLEYGLDKTYHYHMMFFLDGSKVREDITIARIIGELWVDVATKGKGLYYNCNGNKGAYRHCGIGMIKADDLSGREALEHAAFYLTKVDYYIRMVAPNNGRTFDKGNMPKPPAIKRGRPRALTPDDLNDDLLTDAA